MMKIYFGSKNTMWVMRCAFHLIKGRKNEFKKLMRMKYGQDEMEMCECIWPVFIVESKYVSSDQHAVSSEDYN